MVGSRGKTADKTDSNGMVEALILFESIVNSQCKLPFPQASIAHVADIGRVHQILYRTCLTYLVPFHLPTYRPHPYPVL
jgi:hypothetical protein